MKCKEIIKYLDDWAPPGSAWEQDNVGLQVGSPEAEVQKILLCLEITPEVLTDALKRKCNLLITHHPFLFHSVKRFNLDSDKTARLLADLIKNDISVLSYHTNLDYTTGGVSFQLAKALKLNAVEILVPFHDTQSKLVVFVPENAVETVANALYAAGAGHIGEYSGCSFRSKGQGTFLASENAKPVTGKKLQAEKVDEIRLETVIDNWKIEKALSAMLAVHPYEEPAYDVYSLHNRQKCYGAGAIGKLPSPMEAQKFLTHVKKTLNLKNFRYSRGNQKMVSTVAVCGGSAAEYVNTAVSRGADAYITADIRYHGFQDALEKLWLIDAGHYETEIMVLNEVAARLLSRFTSLSSNIFITDSITNPVTFYK
jgi:dinuclear metal center YbgI/SA1388 family protein